MVLRNPFVSVLLTACSQTVPVRTKMAEKPTVGPKKNLHLPLNVNPQLERKKIPEKGVSNLKLKEISAMRM